MGWVEDVSDPGVRTIGALEVLGALGLLLPALTGMATVLVPVAAVGLALVMVGAAATHWRRGELPMIGINAVLLVWPWSSPGPGSTLQPLARPVPIEGWRTGSALELRPAARPRAPW